MNLTTKESNRLEKARRRRERSASFWKMETRRWRKMIVTRTLALRETKGHGRRECHDRLVRDWDETLTLWTLERDVRIAVRERMTVKTSWRRLHYEVERTQMRNWE